jgi:hypothetical protein
MLLKMCHLSTTTNVLPIHPDRTNAWPNPLVNLTRNGVRQSAGKVSCAHSSSPAARRTPLRSGYRQR